MTRPRESEPRRRSLTERPAGIASSPLAAPANGEWHLRNVGAGDATISPVVGVTVNLPTGGSLVIPQGGTVTLKRVAADERDLFGLVTAA